MHQTMRKKSFKYITFKTIYIYRSTCMYAVSVGPQVTSENKSLILQSCTKISCKLLFWQQNNFNLRRASVFISTSPIHMIQLYVNSYSVIGKLGTLLYTNKRQEKYSALRNLKEVMYRYLDNVRLIYF